MSIFDYYNKIGKNSIKATRSDFVNMVGEEGIKDIIKKVFLGGNVRDITEFITQRRLLNSYFAILDLYMKHFTACAGDADTYSDYVVQDLIESGGDAKVLDLWLLGLTNKGLANIVRTEKNIVDYQYAFSDSINDAVDELESAYGELSGIIEVNGNKMDLNWNILSLMFLTIGAQTLSIRGSSKSMNGKMFEKLILGSLLSIIGFNFLHEPPDNIDRDEKIFWLSHMDENEREIDATAVYNGKAVSIDIGFIGQGNPEITLDKVTRFGAYKRIGGLPHDMSTVIIVDTVAENSDLFNKAERVSAHVLQMKNKNWTIEFSKVICEILSCANTLSTLEYAELDDYFNIALNGLDVQRFIN